MKLSLSMLATACALALVLLGGAPARAQLVYDNGPINGTIDAFTINSGFVVSDSFAVSSPTTLTGAQIGLWLNPGDSPTSVDWSIGTSTFGSDISSGTGAILTDTFEFSNSFEYNIDEDTFALNGVLVPSTTYWFTLQNLSIPSSDPGYWDENNGPSAAFDSALGSLAGFDIAGTTGSESFQLFGPSSSVPEPGACALLGSLALTGAAFLRLRRRAR
jgi:hypothetical protein